MREYKFYACLASGDLRFLCEAPHTLSTAMMHAITIAFEHAAETTKANALMICIHDSNDEEIFRTPIPSP